MRGTPGVRAQIFSDFDGGGAQTPTAGVSLDAFGGATVYVNQPVECVAYATDGTAIRPFVEMETATAVEVISQSFTGRNYDSGAAAVGQPLLLSAALDLWKASSGAVDFNVLLGGVSKTLQAAIGSVAGLFVNAKDPTYAGGAVGNGSTDDTAALNAAIAAANAAGAMLFLPAGNYKITGALTSFNGAAGILAYGATITQTVNAAIIAVTGAPSNIFQLIGLTISTGTTSVNATTIAGTVSAQYVGVTITGLAGGAINGVRCTSSATQYLIGCTISCNNGPVTMVSGGLVAVASNFTGVGAAATFPVSGAAGGSLSLFGCTFNGANAGSYVSVTPGAGSKSICVANIFNNSTSGAMVAIQVNGGFTTLNSPTLEIGNAYGSTVTPTTIAVTLPADATGQFDLLVTREARRSYTVDAVSPMTIDPGSTAVHHVRRTAGGAVAIQVLASDVAFNGRTTLILENDSGAGVAFSILATGINLVGTIAAPTVGANRVRVLVLRHFVVNAVGYVMFESDSGDIAGI